ncbi:uncharacterized protein SCHCODRAFT_02610847 [Schizophyllum commune H4-8]|uniref:uncharacterized protein n=1 Tax=Schizophyllum commune (strain H4-8 / FGSC 9210) TaxID=578458 RepID=UPI00215FF744|nr:uncharacterized protein SCHCODRAFT_02610847 [Schizophyllum commune H4-8]KAI5898000.1 hypothetical protein SCHCODRAFT_02610847 [Schizophyllum commune H4-8]
MCSKALERPVIHPSAQALDSGSRYTPEFTYSVRYTAAPSGSNATPAPPPGPPRHPVFVGGESA